MIAASMSGTDVPAAKKVRPMTSGGMPAVAPTTCDNHGGQPRGKRHQQATRRRPLQAPTQPPTSAHDTMK